MECATRRVIKRRKKRSSGLMRTLALMQMGIDYHCRTCQETFNSDRRIMCMCVHVRMWAWTCVYLLSILRSIRCLFHLLYLSLYEQSLIILLSALMDF